MRIGRIAILSLLSLVISFHGGKAQLKSGITSIKVPRGENRTFMLTNEIGLYFCGETNRHNSARYQGLSFLTEEYVEDLWIEIGGKPLERKDAIVTLYTDSLKRFYENLQLTETIYLPDSLPALIVRLDSPKRYLMKVIPLASGSKKLSDFNVDWDGDEKILFISRRNQFVRNNAARKMSLIGVFAYPLADFFSLEFGNFAANKLKQKFNAVEAGELHTMLDGKALVLVILGNSKKEIRTLRNKILNIWHIKFEAPKPQIQGIRKI